MDTFLICRNWTGLARLMSLCAAALLFAVPSVGQDPPDPNAPAEAQAGEQDAAGEDAEADEPAPVPAPDFDESEAARERAQAVFERAIEAYRTAPAIRSETTVSSVSTFAGRVNEQSFDAPMVISSDAVRITLGDITYTAIDNTLYGETSAEENRLYVRDFPGAITTDLFTDFMLIFPYPEFPMMFSERPLENIFIATLDPTIAAHRQYTELDTGKVYDEIMIKSAGDGADIELRFDPDTNLVVRFRTMLRDPNLDENDGTEIIVTMNPEILEALPLEDFVVETEGRRLVSTVHGLAAPPNASDLVKEPAPVFELPNLDGEFVHSDSMAGHVLVIAFWQVAHEGLMPILPAVNALDEWIQTEGRPVRVLAINVGDQPDRVETFWAAQEYEFPLLIDTDLAVARDDFLIGLFPTVFVIGADGVIHQVHTDFEIGADHVELLRDSVNEALLKGI